MLWTSVRWSYQTDRRNPIETKQTGANEVVVLDWLLETNQEALVGTVQVDSCVLPSPSKSVCLYCVHCVGNCLY